MNLARKPRPAPAKYRVLVVDDHPDAADALAMMVRLLGHDSVGATTGGRAISEAEATAFDVAIIDIGLPDVSGHDVARALRRLPSGSGMYLVAMSGRGRSDDRAYSLAAGFDQHLLKPIDGAIVERIIELADDALIARRARLA